VGHFSRAEVGNFSRAPEVFTGVDFEKGGLGVNLCPVEDPGTIFGNGAATGLFQNLTILERSGGVSQIWNGNGPAYQFHAPRFGKDTKTQVAVIVMHRDSGE
jgi:hypothetical protein